MDVPDLISDEVWQRAIKAFDNHEYFVAYNNTLLFVHMDDIAFFTNMEDALDFCDRNTGDHDQWDVEKFYSIEAFRSRIEGIVPGLVYAPLTAGAVLNEPQQSYFNKEELQRKSIIIMENQNNLDYLKTQLIFLGFDEGLFGQLEKKFKEGKQDFTLHASTEYDGDRMRAAINFAYNQRDGKEAYFCNNYIATLEKESGDISQFIYVNNRGQNITFKESRNLLQGRSVFKEMTTKAGEKYHAWLQIDPYKTDMKTGYPKLRQFGDRYPFDLQEALGRVPFRFLSFPDQVKKMIRSLEKGNRPYTMLMRDNKEQRVFIEANPQINSLNMYDENGQTMYYPSMKTGRQHEQAEGSSVTSTAEKVEKTMGASDTDIIGETAGKAEKNLLGPERDTMQETNRRAEKRADIEIAEGQERYGMGNHSSAPNKQAQSDGLLEKNTKARKNSRSNRIQ